MVDANIHVSRGIAIREFPLNIGYGIAVDLEQLVGEAAK